MIRNAESLGADVPGWTTWIPFNLMECNRCSALVPCMPDSRLNHERWHAFNDGTGYDESNGLLGPSNASKLTHSDDE